MGSPKLANENTQGGIFSIRTSPILQGTYLCPLLQGVEWMGSLRDTELSNRSHSRPEQAGQARTAGVCQDGENTADARERMRSEEKWAGETETEEWAPDSPRAKHTEAGPCKKKKKERTLQLKPQHLEPASQVMEKKHLHLRSPTIRSVHGRRRELPWLTKYGKKVTLDQETNSLIPECPLLGPEGCVTRKRVCSLRGPTPPIRAAGGLLSPPGNVMEIKFPWLLNPFPCSKGQGHLSDLRSQQHQPELGTFPLFISYSQRHCASGFHPKF